MGTSSVVIFVSITRLGSVSLITGSLILIKVLFRKGDVVASVKSTVGITSTLSYFFDLGLAINFYFSTEICSQILMMQSEKLKFESDVDKEVLLKISETRQDPL